MVFVGHTRGRPTIALLCHRKFSRLENFRACPKQMVRGARPWAKRRRSLASELGIVAMLQGHVLREVAMSHLAFDSLPQLPSLSLFRWLRGAYAKVLWLADTLSVRLGRLL